MAESRHMGVEAKVAADKLDRLEAENAKLREQMERLITLLRVDHDIDASWDGLRHFWTIGLTENGCLMRDRAFRAEAENKKLREQGERLFDKTLELGAENAKLRELARDLRFCARQSICLKCEHGRICDLRLDERCAELGIEV